jgi:hypothetical protein
MSNDAPENAKRKMPWRMESRNQETKGGQVEWPVTRQMNSLAGHWAGPADPSRPAGWPHKRRRKASAPVRFTLAAWISLEGDSFECGIRNAEGHG